MHMIICRRCVFYSNIGAFFYAFLIDIACSVSRVFSDYLENCPKYESRAYIVKTIYWLLSKVYRSFSIRKIF